jgi:carbamoyl-phosphate synthase small subunit
MKQRRTAKLVLIDGTVFNGSSFGAEGERTGEVCFNTSMTGYQEIMTDPSYAGQILTMTYPLIGNVGVNTEDEESSRPWVEGLVVREASRIRSNFRSETTLDDWLRSHGIIGVEDVDTRRLVRHIRNEGAMMGIISTDDPDEKSLLGKLKAARPYVDIDWMKAVTCGKPTDWKDGFVSRFSPSAAVSGERRTHRVAAIDYGMKRNILRYLTASGCAVRVFPATVRAAEIIDWKPDGVFLSNGPGNPEAGPYAVDCIRGLLGRSPIFGICMGHELLGLALGGRTVKLKFGHRGANHPVMNLETGRIEITCQNHGFALDADSLDKKRVRVTHVNLNDHTNEGISCADVPAFSVQYHPEASPGPHDAAYLFARFIRMMDGTV